MAKRLSVLLSYATGVVAADSAVFVDFDTLPSSAASLSQTLKFLLADEARPLRAALVGEVRAFVYVFGVNFAFSFFVAPSWRVPSGAGWLAGQEEIGRTGFRGGMVW